MPYFDYSGKKIFYEECAEGAPVLLLHGNAASSNMFYYLVPELAKDYKVITIDFLGHGQSDRLDAFPADLWYFEAEQTIAFLRKMNYGPVRLIGTSGGALVAINVGLEAPELVKSIIADSFEGKSALSAFTDNVVMDREASKKDEKSVQFYQGMHGNDWEGVVDNDTRAIAAHAARVKTFFHKPLSTLSPCILLTASREDEYVKDVAPDYLETVYSEMIEEISHGSMHLFETGGHPALLSNQEDFMSLCRYFWRDQL